MLTAEQAREMSGPTAEEHIKVIEEFIITAAKNKKREVIIRDRPYADWLYGSTIEVEAGKAVEILKKAGYCVDLYYVELQFVDMGLRISW